MISKKDSKAKKTKKKTKEAKKEEEKVFSTKEEIPSQVPQEEKKEEKEDLSFSGEEDRYIEAIGRRKTAVARVRLFTKGEKVFLVNGKPLTEYFPWIEDQEKAIASFKKMKCLDKFRVIVKVKGGGRSAQAEAIRHGSARALVLFNPNFKKRLRKAGYLTRDPRMRERKKFGLKRARRAPQWQKR